MIELLGELQVGRVAGERVEVGQRLVHAAVLAGEHLLPLLGREVLGRRDGPIGQPRRDGHGLLRCRSSGTRRSARRTACAGCTRAPTSR